MNLMIMGKWVMRALLLSGVLSGVLLLGMGVGVSAGAAAPDFSQLASAEDESFLPVEQAFRFSTVQTGDNHVRVRWVIAPGYALYRDRITAMAENAAEGVVLAAPAFASTAVFKQDPSFGRVAVFHEEAVADVALARVPAAAAGKALTVALRYQGCADAGLCYPPQTVRVSVPLAVLAGVADLDVARVQAVSTATEAKAPTPVAVPLPAKSGLDDASGIAGFLGHAGLPLILLTFFALGLGLTFTPCVFPMMPILSGLIAGEDSATMTTGRAFRLSLAYVLGMALTYAAVGTLVGYFGARANVQLWLQTPSVLIVFAAVFVLLALSMFGFFELQLPGFLRDRLDALSRQQKGGRLAGVFVMGILSALVVSPCVSAPLAGTLVYISSTGDAVLGGLALLALGLGMGAPLVLIGTSGGRLLPRAGNWMLAVKGVFGVGLLAVAIWLLARVLPGPLVLLLWALLLCAAGIHMGALDAAGSGWPRLWKSLGLLMVLESAFLFTGAVTGQSDPLAPLDAFLRPAVASGGERAAAEVSFVRVDSETALRRELAAAQAAGQRAVVDVYADWCVACQDMARTTFRDAGVVAALAPVHRIQLDLSTNTDDQRRLLDQLHLYGPPALLFYDDKGEEVPALRVQGEVTAPALLTRLVPWR
ncbi:MAG: protein-disulfide reductase DsbD [Moraxellaceae bacterium]|nr:protein-disulfide reductase DsbD [Moraxellaceae bacterium]